MIFTERIDADTWVVGGEPGAMTALLATLRANGFTRSLARKLEKAPGAGMITRVEAIAVRAMARDLGYDVEDRDGRDG